MPTKRAVSVGFVCLVGASFIACASGGASNTTTATARAAVKEAPENNPNATSPEKLEEIEMFFRRKAAQLQNVCYNPEVEKTGEHYQGYVTVQLMVLPAGRASDVKISVSTLKSPGIEACVIESIKAWSWPDVTVPSAYTGTINFKPAW